MMSVDAERCRPEEEECNRAAATGWGVVAVPAEKCLELKQALIYWPEPENAAHVQVVGPKPQSQQKRFADMARLVLRPPRD